MIPVDILHLVGLEGGRDRLHVLQTRRMEEDQVHQVSRLTEIRANPYNLLGNQLQVSLAVETGVNVRGAPHQLLVPSKLVLGDLLLRQ